MRIIHPVLRESFSPAQQALFWSLVDKKGPNECWPWKGVVYQGYGRWFKIGQQWVAHRVAFALEYGECPGGLTVDHVKVRGCEGGLCCNPAHMEPVTQSVNSARIYSHHERPCPHGHGMVKRGRACNACQVEAVARCQRNNQDKYREMKRLQKRKERARQKEATL